MTKTLKDFMEVYRPKSPDEQKFVDKHVVIKHKDRNGNGDDVFKGNTKTIKRKEERHGYNVGEDEKVYEEAHSMWKVDFPKQHAGKAVAAGSVHVKAQNTAHAHKVAAKRVGVDPKMFKSKVTKSSILPEEVEEVDIDTVLDEALDLLMSIDEKTLTPAEMKKREEVVKAIKRDDPKMDKSMAYAIATKTAKRVAEGTMPTADEPTDANKKMAQKVRDLLAKEKKPVKEETEELDEMRMRDYSKHSTETLKVLLQPGTLRSSESHLKPAIRAELKKRSSVKEEVEELDENAKIVAHLTKRYGDNIRKSHVVSAAKDFGVDASKLAKAVRTKLGKTTLEEEQLDELSKDTLKKYKEKARDDFYDADDVDDGRRVRQRYTGLKMASKKLAKEEVEQVDEISTKLATNYTAAASDASKQKNLSTAKQDKRYKSMALAHEKIRARHARVPTTEAVGDITVKSKSSADAYAQHTGQTTKKTSVPKDPKTGKTLYQKVTSEEVEDLDEIFDKTPAGKAKAVSYINKAAERLVTGGITTGLKIANDEPTKKNLKKMGNRQKGIARVVNKLTKEDIIDRTIEKYVPEEFKFTPFDRFIKRLDGLSESHVMTLVGLFEQLNNDNQLKMIEIVETREGINQILNFALENRGE